MKGPAALSFRIAAALLLAVANAGAFAQAEAPPANVNARQMARQVCAACHGVDGNSAAPQYPALAGQVSSYLYTQLRDFAAQGQRPLGGVMGAFALALDDAQMKSLADYFSHQKRVRHPQDAPQPDPLGASIWFAGIPKREVPACAACHGSGGMGMAPSMPRLAGQHAYYLATQLRRYGDGTRTSDSGAVMRQVAHQMTDREIDAVAQFAEQMNRQQQTQGAS